MNRIPKLVVNFALSGIFSLLLCSTTFAESFKILGNRPLGMGGAFVAVAEDALAQYWNPAGLGNQKKFDLEIPISVRAELTGGLLQDVNTIADLADKFTRLESAQQNGSIIDIEEAAALFETVDTLDDLNNPGKGVLVEAQGGLNVRVSKIAVSVNNFTSIGGTPFVDTVNIGLGANATNSNAGVSFAGANITAPTNATLVEARNNTQQAIDTIGFGDLSDLIGAAGLTAGGITTSQQLANALVNQASAEGVSTADILAASVQARDSAAGAEPIIRNISSGNSYTDNLSNATLRGISLTEISIGYGQKFFIEDLYVGANVKALVGRVGFFQQDFLGTNVDGGDFLENFDNNTKNSVQPGLDVGVMYDKRESLFTKFGIVARNINSPKFDQPAVGTAAGEQKYRVEPQVRAGVALYPFRSRFWVIASDLDLTNNITAVPGFSSRIWSLGTELNLFNSNRFNLGLRAGIMNNLAEKDSKLSYTGGIELKFLHFFLSLAGAISSQTEEIQSGTTESQEVPENVQIGLSVGLNW